MPRSSNVLTLALKSRNGCGCNTPFTITRTTPFFCQTNMSPLGAQRSPTRVNGLTVATSELLKLGSANVCARAGNAPTNTNATRITDST